MSAFIGLGKTESSHPGGTKIDMPRLKTAAHEFEGAMMKELLTGLAPGHTSLDGEDDSAGSAPLGEFASEALGRAISNAGGFGIANSIIKQLTPRSVDASTISVHRS